MLVAGSQPPAIAPAPPPRYSCYYLTRNSLTYTAPVMVADPKLGMDITQIGAMTSIFPIAYGMSKVGLKARVECWRGGAALACKLGIDNTLESG